MYRPQTGEWFISQSGSSGAPRVIGWGAPASSGLDDVAVPADYDGDGITDAAVYRRTTGEWFMTWSFSPLAQFFHSYDFLGASSSSNLGDTPVPGDYNGDGFAEPAIYRASTGQWFIRNWTGGGSGLATTTWGSPAHGDYPPRR